MNLQDVRYDPGDAYWEKGPRVREYHEERAAQGLVTLYEAALPPAPRVEPTVQSPAPPLAPPPPVAPKAVAPPKNFPIVSPSVVAADTSAQRAACQLAGWLDCGSPPPLFSRHHKIKEPVSARDEEAQEDKVQNIILNTQVGRGGIRKGDTRKRRKHTPCPTKYRARHPLIAFDHHH